MNSKTTAILITVLLIIGVGVLSFSKMKDLANQSPLPSPSSDGLIFNYLSPSPINTNSQPLPSGRKRYSGFPILPTAQLQNKKAVIETDKGKIEFQIYPEATKAASNFIFLAHESFYDGLTFHRVEPGFVIQGGDPLGNGTGGPGYTIPPEIKRTHPKGALAMARLSGPPETTPSSGSQFYITLDATPFLDGQYTSFG